MASFGLYVHWPFCLSKCPYCDFNSHVREAVDQARWRAALVRELRSTAGEAPSRRVTSIFFGGGTPSLMEPETVAAVVTAAGEAWGLEPEAEITLEANPTSVEAGRFAAYRAAGVNRVSLGVQALDDAALGFLGRSHSAAEAIAAVETAQGIFGRVSFDLIYARPGQSVAQWRSELTSALALAGEHLSVYQLTIEPATAFHAAWRRGELVPPEEPLAARLYQSTQDILGGAGLPAYEVSNHARPGGRCRHNLTYWRYQDYAGIGPGAHGRLTLADGKWATRRHRAPEAWLAAVERDGHATRGRTRLTAKERLSELVMMGLRLTEGLSRAAFRREIGADPEAVLEESRLAALRKAGYLEIDSAGLRATAAGRQRLNALCAYLLTDERAAAVS
ncbi:MAG: radical SAM family heme chaperone HemW [Kiloniellales bacterium]|nr:radical SAM family heme chaperone HemW [Kiloniellales bacterium]